MSLIETELANVFGHGKVKFKRLRKEHGGSSYYRSIAKLVVARVPETMVKITGFSGGKDHISAHIKYISKKSETPLENDRGETFNTKNEIEDYIEDWVKDINSFKRYKKSRDVMHLMLSMPKGTDPILVHEAARDFARNQFGYNHEYLFALHTDRPHPHVHLAVKMKGYDATKLNPRKADIQEWREQFALELRNRGVSAVATKRKSRGVVKKSEKPAVYRLNRIDKTHKKRVAKVTALQVKEMAKEIILEKNGGIINARPWEEKIRKSHDEVKKSYYKVIKMLLKSKALEDKKLAVNLKKFVEAMPKKIITNNHEIKQKLYSDVISLKAEKEIKKKPSIKKDKER